MSAYQGTDNLEVMTEAHNYNSFLVDLVIRHRAACPELVDFGAGIGTFAEMVRQRGFDVLCIETDAAQREVIGQRGFRAVGDLQEIADNSLRYVYSLNVLEHIEDDLAALELISRKLAADGRLLLYVPAFQVLYSSMDRKIGHHRRYTRRHLEELVTRAGLRVSIARYVDSLGFAATLAYKVFGSRTGDLNRDAVKAYDRLVFPISRLLDVVASRVVGKNVYVLATK